MNRRQFVFTAAAAASQVNSIFAQRTPSLHRSLLLVDDYHIMYRSGTHRRLLPLTKYAKNPILQGHVKPWEVAIGWNSTYYDAQKGIYKLWYQAYSGPDAKDRKKGCVICYAESHDGVNWDRPSLNLYSYNDIKDTNIVLLGNGGHSWNYGASVVVTPDDPVKSRRYKLAYFDWSFQGGQEYPGLCVAFSEDGIHWQKHSEAPLLHAAYGDFGEPVPYEDEKNRPWSVPMAISDAFYALYDPKAHAYAIYSKVWIDRPDGGMFWKHAVARTQSKDFIHWSKPELVLTPDDRDPDWLEFHAPPVFYYNDCYFALLQDLHREVGGGIIDVELATSRDGIHWERPFRDTMFLTRGKGDQFDSKSLFLNPNPALLADEFRFFYAGYSAGATGGDDSHLVSGMGMATMKRDRFAVIQPTGHVGQITLNPIDLTGISEITVNADASSGTVRVEILDSNELRVHGFAHEDSVPIRGDGLAFDALWKSRQVSELRPGKYVLRIHLESAGVFAVGLHG
jgi:hypothetical protein